MTELNWTIIKEFLQDKKRLLVTTHANPDGDAIGSQVAFAEYLKQRGIEPVLLNVNPVPKFFRFLDQQNKIAAYDPELHRHIVAGVDGVVIVDLSDWPRLGALGEDIKKMNIPVAVIDHHIPTDDMGEKVISDQSASSTGELIYQFLLTEKNVTFTQLILDALYTCLLTDTGSFRFSNTTPLTHRVAADLLERGAQFRLVYEQVYESYPRERALLMGRVLSGMQFDCDGQLVWFSLTQGMLKETGAEMWQTEGFSELPRNIEGVELSIMFTETSDGRVKVSFRSKGKIPINDFARQFGGGGHQYAAGATLNSDLAAVTEKVLKGARSLVESYQ